MPTQYPAKEFIPSTYHTTFLLHAYKTGLYVTDIGRYSHFAARALNSLVTQKYLTIEHVTNSYSIFTITEKGIKFVKDKFIEKLKFVKLYQIQPILVIGDRIRVTRTLHNDSNLRTTYVTGDKDTLPAGDYKLQSIGKFSVLLVSEDDNSVYRVKLYVARDFLTLLVDNLGTVDEEMCKRFGSINVKNTSKHLLKSTKDNLLIAKLIGKLFQLQVAQNRITGK